jgi:hypothetical protein
MSCGSGSGDNSPSRRDTMPNGFGVSSPTLRGPALPEAANKSLRSVRLGSLSNFGRIIASLQMWLFTSAWKVGDAPG